MKGLGHIASRTEGRHGEDAEGQSSEHKPALVQDFRVLDSAFRVQGSGFMVYGSGVKG